MNWRGRSLVLALVAGVLGLCPGLARAGSPTLELVQPSDRSVVRGAPAHVDVVARAQAAAALGVEVDGELRALILPWTGHTELALEPGLHRINLVGRTTEGAALRSATAQVAAFDVAKPEPLDRRTRNIWTAAIAFVIAVGGGARLRRRGAL